MSSTITVYEGPWMNWTKGPIRGGTITVSLRDAGILVAFFALFIRLVGSHLWSIFCYAIHQWRSRRGDRDALHHQQQALLRNSSSVTSTLWLWLKITWAWRSKTTHPFWRSLLLIAAAILQIIAFGVVGIFNSRITVLNNEVLLRSPYCGSWPLPLQSMTTNAIYNANKTANVLQAQTAYDINTRRELKGSLGYAQSCYSEPSPLCQQYIVQDLPQTTINFNASCPFDEALCLTQAIQIDTGFIDSAVHLGINARAEDRVLYRRTTSCAVLSTDGYAETIPGEYDAAYPYDNTTGFFYGPNYLGGKDYTESFSNYTYDGPYDFWYDLSSYSSLQDFTPIPALHGGDGDVDIVFLMTALTYLGPIDDLWFSAHTLVELPGGQQAYAADNNPSPLGCINQHQFCNPNLPSQSGCTDLTGLVQASQSIPGISFNQKQNATFTRLQEAAAAASLNEVVVSLDQEILLAVQSVAANQGIHLSIDQWKYEVMNLNNIKLAYIQSLMVSYVTGPWGPQQDKTFEYDNWIEKPSTPEGQAMCDNQIVFNRSYYSFSILGMALILALGGFIILLNLTLEPVIRFIRRYITKSGHGAYKQLEWDMAETLQIQRLVYEGQGTGTWHGAPEDVPVTSHGDRFGIPEWTGAGEARRVSRGGSIWEKAGSPLMKTERRIVVTEL